MGRRPCCAKQGLNRGAWSAREDHILTNYINTHGEGKWRDLPQKAGLKRCGKSCRLRWLNYLRPDIKRGNISMEEDELIVRLHKLLGNRWSLIAGRLPGRTDNEIKNYWNTNLSKRVEDDKVVDKYYYSTNKQSSSEDDQLNPNSPHVIRTKAFRCTKLVFPSLKGDNTNITNPGWDSESPISYYSAQQDHVDKDTHNCPDFLVDFDFNDFLMSDVLVSSLQFQESNKEIYNNNNNIEKDYNEVVPDHGDHCVDNDHENEAKLDDFTINYEETRSDHENWINSTETFHIQENEAGLDLNALSSFLNSEDDQRIC